MMQLSQAALALNATSTGANVRFDSVGTDSRKIKARQLFVALKGEHFDGHAYCEQALAQGAAAVMVSADIGVTPAIQVHDTRLALGQLARFWRSQFSMPVLAITGSSGKTTVKEMLSAILRAAVGADAVLATQGNLNNDIGLPLTMLQLQAQHRYAVLEMGMNHTGEIAYLSALASPDIALINNAGNAHIGELGSELAIAQAKGEIFSGLNSTGIAIINADDTYAPLWRELAASHRILSFGLDASADVSARYQLHSQDSTLQLVTAQGQIRFTLPAAGLHNVKNALAAAAVAVALEIPLATIAQGLQQFAGIKGRLQRKAGQHGATLVDDSYNANPVSMKAAIDVLAGQAGKTVFVMGDMGELGSAAVALHAEVGAYAKQKGVQHVLVLGELSQHAAEAYGVEAQVFSDVDAIAQATLALMDKKTTVLVKGSRFMRMERVVERLMQSSPEKELS
jgi:UDP-N-acetylmuramoyl-tripeptide--D-alanyl-D-alanine ligase